MAAHTKISANQRKKLRDGVVEHFLKAIFRPEKAAVLYVNKIADDEPDSVFAANFNHCSERGEIQAVAKDAAALANKTVRLFADGFGVTRPRRRRKCQTDRTIKGLHVFQADITLSLRSGLLPREQARKHRNLP